jgi:MFS family permease
MDGLLPPAGLPRAIAFQSAVIAIGGGTYITGSVVFFTHVLHLSPLQIGTGLSVAGLAGLAMSLPLGGLADRLGGQRSWVIGAVVEAAGFASYPLAKARSRPSARRRWPPSPPHDQHNWCDVGGWERSRATTAHQLC